MGVKYRDKSAMSCAKTAEPIEMVFRTLSQVDPRNHATALDRLQIPHA